MHEQLAPGEPGTPPVFGPSVPPGMYPDPWWPGRLRRWDGRQWGAETQPLPSQNWASRLRVPAKMLGPGSIITFSVTGMLALLAVLLSVGPVAFVVATFVAFLPLPLYALAALSLNRFHPEPRASLLWTFLAGSTTVVFAAILINSILGAAFTVALGEALGELVSLAVLAPVVEETGKGAVLLVLFLRFRHQINGPLDGIVYASMVGLGFAAVENILYYGQAIAEGSIVAVFVIRGMISPFAHPLFTAMTGIGLGIYGSRRGGWRNLAPVGGLLLAMLLHALWNGSTQIGEGVGFLLAFFFVMVPAFAAVVAVALVDGRREKRLLLTHLGPEVSAGLLTQADLRLFSETGPRRALIGRARRLHPEAGRAAHELAAVLIELAFLRERLARGVFSERYGSAAQVLQQLQQRARSARWALPPPPLAAPWSGLGGALGLQVGMPMVPVAAYVGPGAGPGAPGWPQQLTPHHPPARAPGATSPQWGPQGWTSR